MSHSSNITLAYLPRAGAQEGKYEDVRPLPQFLEHAGIGTIGLQYNYANEAWLLPRGTRRGDTVIPSLASILADRNMGSDADFRVNYAFDPASIPVYSAADVIDGRVGKAQLRGKTVIVGTDSERLGDQFMIPGWGKASGVYLHILGAETLKAGRPVDLGWIPAYLAACLLAFAAIKRKLHAQVGLLGGGAFALLALPMLLERSQVFADITAGLFVITWVATGITMQNMKRRGLTNTVSGLPNLNALRRAGHESDRPLIVARVINYAQIVSTLSVANERALTEQIVSRLKVGSEVSTVYQGDEGIFAWTVPAGTAIGHHASAVDRQRRAGGVDALRLARKRPPARRRAVPRRSPVR